MSPKPLQKQSEAEIPIERREERSERLLRRRRRHSREVHGREKNGDKESQRITKEQKRKTQLRFSSGNLRVQSSFGETLLSIETVAGISEAQATFMLQPFHHSPQLCQTKANRLRLRHYCLVFVRCAQYVSVNAIKMQFKVKGYLYALITLITLIAFHRWLDAALLSSWRASESSPCGSPSCDQIDSIR